MLDIMYCINKTRFLLRRSCVVFMGIHQNRSTECFHENKLFILRRLEHTTDISQNHKVCTSSSSSPSFGKNLQTMKTYV